MDSSGLVLTRPDSFLPNVDIIKTDLHYYVLMDLPGMHEDEVIVSRNNVTTVVKGKRKKQEFERKFDETVYEKDERKFGDFTLVFKIPEEFERKWSDLEMSNGVLKLTYKRDSEDGSDAKENQFLIGSCSIEKRLDMFVK